MKTVRELVKVSILHNFILSSHNICQIKVEGITETSKSMLAIIGMREY